MRFVSRRLLISFVEGIKKSTSKRYAVQDIRDDCLLDLLKVLLNVTHDLGECVLPHFVISATAFLYEVLQRWEDSVDYF